MDFFQHQDSARRRTGLLVVLLTLAVAAIIFLVFAVLVTAVAIASERAPTLRELTNVRAPIFPVVLGFTVAGVVVSSLWKMATLGAGGVKLLEGMGARTVAARGGDREQVLVNVVEEMSLASGVPAPRVMVLPEEPAINGFVCGTKPADATLVVTRGALDRLTRDELQALVAHEFSHLFHGDTRINLRLIGILHGILFIALCGRGLLQGLRHISVRSSSSRDRDSGGGGVVLFILGVGASLWALGSVGEFFARLIKLAINRQREFLADAAAVQFTRNPDAMVGLLGKILGGGGGVVKSARAQEFSHFFFADISRHWLGSALATHPPLLERIHRIQPGWQPPAGMAEKAPSAGRRKKAAAAAPLEAAGLVGLAEVRQAPARIAEAVGQAGQAHLERMRETLAGLPPALREACGDPLGAQAVVVLLLTLDNRLEPDLIAPALDLAEPGLEHELRRLWETRAGVTPEARLPLLDLCLPSLRTMTAAQHNRFRLVVDGLCQLDMEYTVFEVMLRHALGRHLDASFTRPPLKVIRHYRLEDIQAPVSALFSALALFLIDDDAASAKAFAAVAAPRGWTWTALPPEQQLPAVCDGLDILARASFQIRREILVAATELVMHDRQVTPLEAEWIRLLADALECPLPPWMQA